MHPKVSGMAPCHHPCFELAPPDVPSKTLPALVAHALELFAPLPGLRVKPMFGGWGFYSEDVFFALVAFDSLYLKADAASWSPFEAAGCQPFRYSYPDGRTLTMATGPPRKKPWKEPWKAALPCCPGRAARSSAPCAPGSFKRPGASPYRGASSRPGNPRCRSPPAVGRR
jgi:TfoX/Sxy family transcriptional regulator of competence genes